MVFLCSTFSSFTFIRDLRTQSCVQSIFEHKLTIENSLNCIYVNPESGSLVSASKVIYINALRNKDHALNEVRSHEFPIRAALYNRTFNQVVSGCDGGVINVWDAMTGEKVFRFAGVHGKSEITAMIFDAEERRLITGGRGIYYHIIYFS